MVQRARIRLLSTSVQSLAKICDELSAISVNSGIRMKGPIPFPTRRVILPVRKSPCGNGTQTWEHFEMKIHKRLVDLDADEQAMHQLMRLNVPNDIRIEVELS
ncbi:MAG: 30S ribosomal protein S10 [Candidatus Heimdallarchaeota archaeon]|nr:30S ribosomal protein S10 [Candidatus Heimdallarchaeota archaeon]